MLRISYLMPAIVLLAGCGPQSFEASEPLPPPFTTNDPTGLFPESPTVNLQRGAHRAFILEKREFFLGEPIVVEFRTWPRNKEQTFQHIGGSSRMFGRDNTFAFLMRSADGTWLTGPQPGSDRGGLLGGNWVTDEQPIRIYNAVQRWCVIDGPGAYDLYGFYLENAMPPNSEEYLGATKDSGATSVAWLPGAIQEWLDETESETFTRLQRKTPAQHFESVFFRWDTRWRLAQNIRSAHDFVHYRITIRKGTAQEEEAMVKTWLERIDEERANHDSENHHVRNRMGAVLEAIHFDQTRCWIPTQVAWAEAGTPELLNGAYVGLLLNPHLEVTRAALRFPDSTLKYWMYVPRPPGLTDRLKKLAEEDSDPEIRSRAAHWLAQVEGGA